MSKPLRGRLEAVLAVVVFLAVAVGAALLARRDLRPERA